MEPNEAGTPARKTPLNRDGGCQGRVAKDAAASLNKRGHMALNFIAQVAGFLMSVGINFLLTPFIVRRVGSEAYGFIGLANNFIGYAEIATIALNAVAARFITIRIYQSDSTCASRYFSTVIYTNILLSALLMLPSAVVIILLDKMVNIPSGLLSDIRLLFSFVFLCFFVGLISSSFDIAAFSRNRQYLSSVQLMLGNILRVSALAGAFLLFYPRVWFVGLALVIMNLYLLFWNRHYAAKLLPELKIRKRYFDRSVVRELLSSGIWNTTAKLGQILSEGLDLLLANLLIGVHEMGLLAIAKLIPTLFIKFLMTVSNIFVPQMTICYAQGDTDGLYRTIKFSMKLICLVTPVLNAAIFAFGQVFYSLWIPEEDPKILVTLTLLSTASFCVIGPLQPIFQLFVITDKLKKPSLVMIASGVVSVGATILLLKLTGSGIYIIAGVSGILAAAVGFVFHLPYGARCLGLDWKTFYPEIGKCVCSCLLLTMGLAAICRFVSVDSWGDLMLCAASAGVLGLLLNSILILDKNERSLVINALVRRFASVKRKYSAERAR